MKKLFLSVAGLFTAAFIYAQSPVSWTFTAKKTADKTFEVHMTATIQKSWHLYSQNQPEDAVANPTSFTYCKSIVDNGWKDQRSWEDGKIR
jgi:thiol:disulfide interchange protein DsbD